MKKEADQPAKKFAEEFPTSGDCCRCGAPFSGKFRGHFIKHLAFCRDCLLWALSKDKRVDHGKLLADLMRGAHVNRRKTAQKPNPRRRNSDYSGQELPTD